MRFCTRKSASSFKKKRPRKAPIPPQSDPPYPRLSSRAGYWKPAGSIGRVSSGSRRFDLNMTNSGVLPATWVTADVLPSRKSVKRRHTRQAGRAVHHPFDQPFISVTFFNGAMLLTCSVSSFNTRQPSCDAAPRSGVQPRRGRAFLRSNEQPFTPIFVHAHQAQILGRGLVIGQPAQLDALGTCLPSRLAAIRSKA